MPHATRARTLDARRLAAEIKVGHQEAVELLGTPDPLQTELLTALLEGNADTLRTARTFVEALPSTDRLLCAKCGWTRGGVCPECSQGCGCSQGCDGWRHREYSAADDEYPEYDARDGDPCDDPYDSCPECGGGTAEYDAECRCDEPPCRDCGHPGDDAGCAYTCECPSC